MIHADDAQPEPPRPEADLPRLTLHFDGGSRGNPGPGGVGVVIADEADGTVRHARGFFLGRCTNNQAEYTGLIRGVELAAALKPQHLDIVSDSELLVKQIKGVYRCKNEKLKPLFAEANALLVALPAYTIRHVKRNLNQDADALANAAMDAKADLNRDPA